MEPLIFGTLADDTMSYNTQSCTSLAERHNEFQSAYRKLGTDLRREGFFNASRLYYARKVLEIHALLALSVALAYYNDGSVIIMVASATLCALMMQQAGWLSHDFLHHQVFQNRNSGNMTGLWLGNVLQGYSVSWWKDKHNSHHAVPNLITSAPGAKDGDPDIDTLPLLAWSKTMLKQMKPTDSFGAFMVSKQALLYFPILCFARVSWVLASLFQVFDGLDIPIRPKLYDGAKSAIVEYPLTEMFGLLFHYVWYLTLAYLAGVGSGLGVTGSIAWIVLTTTICGFCLGLVFGLGHNGMAVYDADKRPDHWTLQVSTTRNITTSPFVHWFCGGLEYQVDHHLFPMIPRHHLPKVHDRVVAFCNEHGVTYCETSMLTGTKDVLSHLSAVTSEMVHHFPAI